MRLHESSSLRLFQRYQSIWFLPLSKQAAEKCFLFAEGYLVKIRLLYKKRNEEFPYER